MSKTNTLSNHTTKTQIEKGIIYVFLAILVLLCVAPFYLMIISATRSAAQIQNGFSFMPGTAFKENLDTLKEYVDIWRSLTNSATIAITTTILTSYFAALTAHGLQFYEFKGKKIIFTAMLIMMMVPGQLGLIGYYNLVFKYGMLDSYLPLIIPSIANIFGIFFIRQYMATTIHPALIEAARIDGSNELSIFHKIILPLTAPATATIAIMGFIGNWNSYIMPRILLTSLDKRTLPVALGVLKGSRVFQMNFGAVYASITISVIPIIIVFILASKYIVNGISSGGVKG